MVFRNLRIGVCQGPDVLPTTISLPLTDPLLPAFERPLLSASFTHDGSSQSNALSCFPPSWCSCNASVCLGHERRERTQRSSEGGSYLWQSPLISLALPVFGDLPGGIEGLGLAEDGFAVAFVEDAHKRSCQNDR
jgi:hypothetical protein